MCQGATDFFEAMFKKSSFYVRDHPMKLVLVTDESSEQYSPMSPETQQKNKLNISVGRHLTSNQFSETCLNINIEMCVYNCTYILLWKLSPMSSNMKAQMNEIKNTTHEFFIDRSTKVEGRQRNRLTGGLQGIQLAFTFLHIRSQGVEKLVS